MVTDRDRMSRPRKRFGQHFLRDAATIRRIVECIRVEDRTPVVEIGPGRGALTRRSPSTAANCISSRLIKTSSNYLQSDMPVTPL